MKLIAPIITASLGLATAAAFAAGLPSADATFAKKAAQGGMAEVAMGQLAADKGASSDVKTFGQTMVTDHSAANDELTAAAAKADVNLPSGPTSAQEKMKASLQKLDGAAFDSRYASMMVKDHEEDVALFREEANTGKDPTLRAFAQKTLPTLESHLDMAKKLQSAHP